nr:hypothetical protein [Cryobacterium sp. Hz9]
MPLGAQVFRAVGKSPVLGARCNRGVRVDLGRL